MNCPVRWTEVTLYGFSEILKASSSVNDDKVEVAS